MVENMKIESLVAAFVALFVMLGVASNAMAAPGPKVYVCHKDKSIRISQNAEQAHLNHGDLPGKCGEIVLDQWLDLRCDSAPESGIFQVSNISFSEGVTAEIAAITVGDNCAEVQKTAQDANCRLARDYGTPDAQAYIFNCPGLPEED